jgi:hypothetical protein
MTSHPTHALILRALQTVTPDRLQKAVLGLCDGTSSITLTRQTETELRGLVRNGDGKEYGVTLTEALTACSCPDALYRGVVCKHATAAALFALRQPEIKPEQAADNSYMIHLLSHTPTKPEPKPVSSREPVFAPKPTRTIHLLKAGNEALCGVRNPQHFWVWPNWPQTAWEETCPECATRRLRPALAAVA